MMILGLLENRHLGLSIHAKAT